jgi:cytochrome P450
LIEVTCLGLAEEIGFWAPTRYDDVVAAHLDTDTFSSSHGVTLDRDGSGGPFLIVKDPPEHTLHRRIAARMFTPRRIAQLEPFIRVTAAGLLDRVQDRDSFDLVQEFSFRLPLDVISELVGIPAALQARSTSSATAAGRRTRTRQLAPYGGREAAFTWRVRLVVLLLTHDGNNHYPDRRGDRARAGGTD